MVTQLLISFQGFMSDYEHAPGTYASLSGQHATYVQPRSLTLDGPEYEGVPNKGNNFVDYYASADIFSN